MKKLVKIVALIAVVGALVGLIVANLMSSSDGAPDEIWNENTVVGQADGEHHFVLYTDLGCSYCYHLSSVISENQATFEQFLAENNVAFEFRVIPYLGSDLSIWGAEAAACAADEGRFWEFYLAAIRALGEDYYEGSTYSTIPENYFAELGARLGMPEKFSQCYLEHEKNEAVVGNLKTATRKMSSSGVPYEKFGSYTSGGFDSSWGWSKLKQMMEAGL